MHWWMTYHQYVSKLYKLQGSCDHNHFAELRLLSSGNGVKLNILHHIISFCKLDEDIKNIKMARRNIVSVQKMENIIGGKMQTLKVQVVDHQYVQKIEFSLNPKPEKLEEKSLKVVESCWSRYFQLFTDWYHQISYIMPIVLAGHNICVSWTFN